MSNDNYRARRPQHDPALIRKLAEDVLGVPKPAASTTVNPSARAPEAAPPEATPMPEPGPSAAPKPMSATVARASPAPDDGEHVQFTTRIPKTLQRELRLYAAQYDVSIQTLTVEALREHLEGRKA